jgi:hypothetical protein
MSTMNKYSEYFKKNKYVYIENVLSEEICSIATLYALLDEEQRFFPEPEERQVPGGAHSKYSDLLMESLLFHMKDFMEQNTDLDLYPTYSYYRVYRDQDELKPHVDRPSCEISSTIFLGYDYENKEYSWPIVVDGKKVHMSVGSVIIYKGTEVEHYREKFNIKDPNAFHVQLFLHYVDKNGPNVEWAFDKRPGIGFPATGSW